MAAPQGAGAPRREPLPDPAGARAGHLEEQQVRAMFDRIAGVYDLMNTAMTAGLHHRWRARAVDEARVGPGDRVLDVATGTGDLAIELAGRVAPGGAVTGGDFSEAMLEHAREKVQRLAPLVRPRFEWLDAMSLPYEDDVFDAATVGFGARNFDRLGQGLSEMIRVVRPGGRVVVLEITTPTRPPLAQFYSLWFDRLVPALGAVAGKASALAGKSEGTESIASAYTYLPNSVKRFPGPEALAGELERAGLTEITYLLTAGGIVAIHAGTVPGKPPR
jgi:demethylmenaquinone methyltransferase / 2-methoxy-6-polyprenyl-1,4-benzoquinol methylase